MTKEKPNTAWGIGATWSTLERLILVCALLTLLLGQWLLLKDADLLTVELKTTYRLVAGITVLLWLEPYITIALWRGYQYFR